MKRIILLASVAMVAAGGAQAAELHMTRAQCRALSLAQGYSPEEFQARSIWCDKKYAGGELNEKRFDREEAEDETTWDSETPAPPANGVY